MRKTMIVEYDDERLGGITQEADRVEIRTFLYDVIAGRAGDVSKAAHRMGARYGIKVIGTTPAPSHDDVVHLHTDGRE